MANAGFGLPLEYTYVSTEGAPTRPWSNVMNDEPGLVYEYAGAGSGGSINSNFNVTSLEDISFIAVLGSNVALTFQVTAYTSDANRTADSGGVVLFTGLGNMSVNRTGLRKYLFLFTPTDRKYLKIRWVNVSGSTTNVRFWRMLIGKWVSPADNIEVGAVAKIDDRQLRRYAVTGRRNFKKVGIFPAFTGQWPWISKTEYDTMIKPMMLKYGASTPVLFCLNYEDTSWGENDLYYGDLEKDQATSHDDGQLYSYSFSIVDIAAVSET